MRRVFRFNPASTTRIACVIAIALLSVACKKDKAKQAPALAQVYAGPITLSLRKEITPGSKPVASVQHGEQLDVIQVRRRFVRVRTSAGLEGWTDARNLLTTEQMDSLQELAKRGSAFPSQGEATVYATLNMHSEPNRQSTSFYQLKEGVRVDVIDHELAERVKGANAPVTLKIDKPVRPSRKKTKTQPAIPAPPRGPVPALPPNWLELSKTEPTEEDRKAEEEEAKHAPKPVMEHWTLVRTKDGKSGWVLSRNLIMAIPDEVAQYSEGARITSYFPLATVQDGDQTKHHWLWTTIRDGDQNYEFDSFRIFIWNLRRHRYETAYIERNVEGYYPTDVHQGKPTTFSLILRNKEDGKLYKKTFAFEGYIVRKLGEAPYTPPEEDAAPKPASAADSLAETLKGITGKVLK